MNDQAQLENPYIVVGVDSSPGSKAALSWALAQARLTGAVVEVGTTVQPVDVRIKVAPGPAAQVLLKAAAGADLLVVGSRGHGAFAGMLLGSVSQHCAQHAPCPVVVIPDDESPATR